MRGNETPLMQTATAIEIPLDQSMFAPAYSGFPVDLDGVGELYAAFLKESRTRGRWWRPVQEIRIRGLKRTGEALREPFAESTNKSRGRHDPGLQDDDPDPQG